MGIMPTWWRGALCLPILSLGAHVSLETVFWCWQTQSASDFCLPVVKRDSCMWLGVYWLSDLNHKCFPTNCAVPPVCLTSLVTPPCAAAWGLHWFWTGLLLLSSSLASRWAGIVKYYRVHLRSESCCQAGTVTAKILQLNLHQPVNSSWKGQNTENSES